MIDPLLYDTLQRRATAGDPLTVSGEQVKALADEMAAARAARAREQQLVAALKMVEFGMVSLEATAPACPVCRSARGMGHLRSCPVGSALSAAVPA